MSIRRGVVRLPGVVLRAGVNRDGAAIPPDDGVEGGGDLEGVTVRCNIKSRGETGTFGEAMVLSFRMSWGEGITAGLLPTGVADDGFRTPVC